MSNEKDVQDLDNQILKQMLQDFLDEATELLDQLNLVLIQLEDEPENEDSINQIFRIVHTIKGSAAFAGLDEMSSIGRKMEDMFGLIRKGDIKISSSLMDLMFEALEGLSALRESAASGTPLESDIAVLIAKFDSYQGSEGGGKSAEDGLSEDSGLSEADELLQIYKSSYDQLAGLKHLVYSSMHLDDEDTLITLFSQQIDEIMSPERNSFWLIKNDKNVVQIAINGKMVSDEDRRTLEIDSSDILKRVIYDQKVVWSSTHQEARELLPKFTSPIIVPLKSQPKAYGFFVLDPEESAEVEVYQFVGEFISMVLKNAKLHQQVDEQRKELDEMTAILFRQNNVLSTLYHVELDLMRITNPIDLCRIVTEAFVHDLETRSAAIFLRDESTGGLKGIWGSGGLDGIESLELPLDAIAPIKQSLESGRIVSHKDSDETMKIGDNELEGWIIMGLKGREITHGVVVAELEEDDITDSMSILSNYSGILLDNLNLQKDLG